MILKLCNARDLPPEGQLKAFRQGPPAAGPASGAASALGTPPTALCVGVFQGKPYAVANACPHQGASLAAGTLLGAQVACPAHGWLWDLRTGDPAHPRDPSLQTFELRQYGTEIFVRIPGA